MSAHIEPILVSFAVFFILAMIITMPWAVYQYRKHGYFSFWRNAILFSFIFYLLTAFFLVSLPLPANRHNYVSGQSEVYSQLHLFRFVEDIQRESGVHWQNIATYRQMLHSPAFFQFTFNLLMLLPLGVYYRFYKIKQGRWWKILGLGLMLSLFFEISQRTALFGYYDVPYRLFDVDDLLANSLGALLGYWIAPVCLFFIPSQTKIAAKGQRYQSGVTHSYGIQLIELLVSLFVGNFLTTGLSIVFGPFSKFEEVAIKSLFFFGFTVMMPMVTKGYTVGGIVVKLRLLYQQQPSFYHYLKRYLIISVPIWLREVSAQLATIQSDNIYVIVTQLICMIVVFVIWFAIYGNVIIRWLKSSKVPYFNKNSDLQGIRK